MTTFELLIFRFLTNFFQMPSGLTFLTFAKIRANIGDFGWNMAADGKPEPVHPVVQRLIFVNSL
jgi:hypothetical protein